MNGRDLLNSSVSSEDVIKQNLYKFYRTHCTSEQSVRVFDPVTGEFENRDVPCGVCSNCRSLYRNMWYSRMYLHSLYYQHIYFITLTYSPVDESHVSWYYAKVAQSEFSGTIPCFDNNNSSHDFNVSPCVLYKPHLQNFFKRLRKQTGAHLTYYAVGEYGHCHGRPHYHAIIWSEQPLTYANIKRAWSKQFCIDKDNNVIPFRGHKNNISRRFVFLYGRVDFHDLVKNGTIAGTTSTFGAKNAFSYVCKYLTKSDYPDYRVKLAWRNIKYISEFYNNQYIIDDILTPEDYEKEIFSLYGNSQLLYCESYADFKKTFAPFSVCSRAESIGLKYFNDNVERFCQGQFGLPKDFEGKSLLFPLYFKRKCEAYLYPLRRERFSGRPRLSLPEFDITDNCKCSSRCTSLSSYSRSLSLGSLPSLCRFWSKAADFISSCPDISDVSSFLQSLYAECGDTCCIVNSFNDNLSLYDVVNRYRLDPDFLNHGFNLLRYNRRERSYMSVGFMSFESFISEYLDKSLKNYVNFVMPLRDNSKLDRLSFNEYLDKLSSLGLSHLRFEYEVAAETSSNQLVKLYNLKHQNDL